MENFEKIIKKADEFLRERNFSQAISILKDGLEIYPNHPYLYYLLGVARMKCGFLFLAEKSFEKANQLLPNNSENLRGLGWVKILLGKLEEGKHDLREAINLNLTNAYAYMDLGMSYIHYFEFEDGFEWLERAKALKPNDPAILENYKIAEELKKDFSKYSSNQLAKLRGKKLNPKIQKEFRLAIIENFLKKGSFTDDEMTEILEELKLNGLSGQILLAKDPNDPRIKEARNYIEWHKKVKDVERKLIESEEKEIIENLLSKNGSPSELKEFILRLAHQGTKTSLEALKKFKEMVGGEPEVWADLAIQECQSFLEEKKFGGPGIHIQKLEE